MPFGLFAKIGTGCMFLFLKLPSHLNFVISEFESQFKIKTKQRKMEKNQKFDVDSTYSLFWNPDSFFVHA